MRESAFRFWKPSLLKSLLAMKFSLLLLMITLQASARSYSQDISISMANAPLTKVFSTIEKKTGYLFWYESKLLDKVPRVNVEIRNASLTQVLDQCFRNQALTYAIVGRTIVLQPRRSQPAVAPLAAFTAVEIKGRVTDEAGRPLAGVSVSVKGTGGGTTTDASGYYSLEVPGGGETLVFTYIGYQPQEIPYTGQSMIPVVMRAMVSSLNQLVVVGYGTQKKGDLTGSISAISQTDFDRQPIIRVSDVIKGRAAGVFVKTPNGAPGSAIKIRIRGENSINGDNTPLYVIDGFVGGDIRTISPADIASIDVLKDASATAIYGSRGSNGVVIITTKTGQSDKHRIDFSAFYSTNRVSKKYDLLNGPEYMRSVNERKVALGQIPQFTDAEITAVTQQGSTDWQNAIMRGGSTQNYQLAFSGGHGPTSYYLSGNIADQQGIVLNSWYKRYGLRFNLHSDFSSKFHIEFNGYGTFENSRNNYAYFGRNTPYGESLAFPPNIPIKNDSTGEYTTSPKSYGPVAGNPVFAAETQNKDNNLLSLLSNVQLSYDFTDHLQLSVSGGVNGAYYNNPSFDQNAPQTPVTTSQGEYDNGFTWALQNTDKLHYANTFGGIHHLDISVIYEQQQSVTKTSYVVVSSFPSIALGYNNLGMGIPFRAGSGYSAWSIQSYLGRVNYTLMGKYLFTATFRADGSSKFQKGNQYGYFPSAAFAWRLSDEPFIRQAGIFDDLKLRLSYGLTGSQAINPYQTLTLLSEGNDYLFNGTDKTVGIGPGTPGNPDLKWETTAQSDIGLDFTVLKGRLSVTADYYHKKTTDLLLAVPIPGYIGGGSVTSNVGSMQNQGFEMLVSGIVVNNRRFRINTGVNLSVNRNKILNLGASDKILTNAGYASSTTPYFILEVGKPLGLVNGYIYEGLWQADQKDAAAKYGHVPGDPKYKDVNGDGTIDGNDMVPIGNTQPKYTLGWNGDIHWDDFDLNFLVTGVQGNDVWDLTRYLILSTGSDIKYPTSREVLNHWTPDNTQTDIPGFSATDATASQSSRYIENGSFFRLNNLSAGYNLPPSLLAKWKIFQARVYLSAQNLVTITRYKGEDPELSNTSTTTDVAAGVDNATFPMFRTYTIGVQLGL